MFTLQAFKEADGLHRQVQDAVAEAEELRRALEASRRHSDGLQATLDRVGMEAQCLRGDIEVLSAQLQALQVLQGRFVFRALSEASRVR